MLHVAVHLHSSLDILTFYQQQSLLLCSYWLRQITHAACSMSYAYCPKYINVHLVPVLDWFDLIWTWICDWIWLFFFEHHRVGFLVLVSAVLAVIPALPHGCVQSSSFEKSCHEWHPLPAYVRLSSKEVEHRVCTAADEGDGSGHGSALVPNCV